jgi:hypothetical protein
MKIYLVAPLLLLGSAMSSNVFAQSDDWKFGIGTGFMALNVKGDMGFYTPRGAPKFDLDMSSEDIQEYLNSALGVAGYASKGDVTILYKVGRLELKNDSISGTLPRRGVVNGEASFTVTSAELDGVYNFAETGAHRWGALAGVRYTKHKFETELSGAITGNRTTDHDWTDLVLGITHQVPISPTLKWHNRFDVAGGGSEGAYHINTGIAWQFAKSWSADFYADYLKTKFENNSRGESNWYLYDAAEYGAGIGITYHF